MKTKRKKVKKEAKATMIIMVMTMLITSERKQTREEVNVGDVVVAVENNIYIYCKPLMK